MQKKSLILVFTAFSVIGSIVLLKVFVLENPSNEKLANQQPAPVASDTGAVGFDIKSGTLRIGMAGSLKTTDPLFSDSNVEKFFILHARQGLAKYSIRGTAELSNGIDSKTISSTKTQFTLTGKQIWNTGARVTVADYIYSWKRALLTKKLNAGPLLKIKNAHKFIESNGKSDIGIREIKNNVLEVELAEPNVRILSHLTHPYMLPIKSPSDSKSSLKKRLMLTNGPYFHRIGGTSKDIVLQLAPKIDQSTGQLKQIRLAALSSSENIERYKGKKLGMIAGLPNSELRDALNQKIKFRTVGSGRIFGIFINSNSKFSTAEGRQWTLQNFTGDELRKIVTHAKLNFVARPLVDWLPQKMQRFSSAIKKAVQPSITKFGSSSATILVEEGSASNALVEAIESRFTLQKIKLTTLQLNTNKFKEALKTKDFDFAFSEFDYFSPRPTAYIEGILSQNSGPKASWQKRVDALLGAIVSVQKSKSETRTTSEIIGIVQSNSSFIPMFEWQSLLLLPPKVAGIGLHGFLPVPLMNHAKILSSRNH